MGTFSTSVTMLGPTAAGGCTPSRMPQLPGSVYAVVSGHLVRIQIGSGKILSILRPLPD